MYANDDKPGLPSKSLMQTPSLGGMADMQAPSYGNMFGTSGTSDIPSMVPSYSENIWSAESYNFGSSTGMSKEPSFSEDVSTAWMSESMGNYGSMYSGERKRSHTQAAMGDYDYGRSDYGGTMASSSYSTSQNWSDHDHGASGRPKKSKVSSTVPKTDYFNETVQMENDSWGQASSYQMHGGKESNGMAKRRQQNQQPQAKEDSDEPSNWNEIKTLLTHLSKHKSLSKLLGEASKELFQEEMADRSHEESYGHSGQASYFGGQNYRQTDYGHGDQWTSTPRQRDGQTLRGRGKQTGRGQSTSQYGQGHGNAGGGYGQSRSQFGQQSGQSHGQFGQSRSQSGQSRGQFGRGRGTGRGNDRQSGNFISSGGLRGTGSRGRGRGQQDGDSSSNFVRADGQSSRGRGFGTRGRGQMGRGQESRGRGSFRGDRGGSMPAGHFRGMGKGREGSQNSRFGQTVGTGERSTIQNLEYLRDRLQSDNVSDTNAITKFHEAAYSGESKLHQVYNCEEAVRFQHRPLYSGSLEVCGVFIVRCMGRNKKAIKHDVYTLATDRLKNVAISEIVLQIDPGLPAVNEKFTKLGELGSEGTVDLNAVIGELVTKRKPLNQHLRSDLSALFNYITGAGLTISNPISLFEQAFQACHVKCSHRFLQLESAPGFKPRYSGAIVLGDMVIGEAGAQTKKDCKQLAYTNAEDNVKTKSIADIMNGKTSEEFEQHTPLSMPKIKEAILATSFNTGNQSTLANKLDILSRGVQKTTDVIHNMTNLDSLIFNLDLTPTIVYYKKIMSDGKPSLFCDFYINDLLIASCAETGFKNRKDAHMSAYTVGWQILAEKSGSTIAKNETLTDEIRNGENVVECIVKGKGRAWSTNKGTLNRLNVDPFNPPKKMSSLLIMQRTEFAVDLPKFAFGILLYSATMCEMVVDCDTIHKDGMFHCTITLQNEDLADAIGKSKALARNRAAFSGISKLVRNGNTIVETTRSGEDKVLWTAWPDIYKRSEELRKVDGAPEVPITNYQDHSEYDSSLITEPPDKYVVQALTELIKDSLVKDRLQEVIIGPGMPAAETNEITRLAKEMNLRVDQRHAGNRQYFSFYNRYQSETMIPLLKKNDGKLGRFTLCPIDKAKAMWNCETPAVK